MAAPKRISILWLRRRALPAIPRDVSSTLWGDVTELPGGALKDDEQRLDRKGFGT